MAFVQDPDHSNPPLFNLNIGFMIDAQRRCRTEVSGSDSYVGNMESLHIGDIEKSHPVGYYCSLTSQQSRGEKESVVRMRRIAFYFWSSFWGRPTSASRT